MFLFDLAINRFDRMLRTLTGVTAASRSVSGFEAGAEEALLNAHERRHSAGLMRVNHVGEICAQALYDGQSACAKSEALRSQFEQAGREEADLLAWTAQRLEELGSRPSLLNPIWYAGAFVLGVAASRMGDAQSLGFVVETERQVEAHLQSHLEKLPANDTRSRAIVEQMRVDEVAHGAAANAMGAAELPQAVRACMRSMAKVMTTTAYYI